MNMKKIQNVDLAHLNNGAHFLFITDAVKRVTADTKVKAKVTAELTTLENALKAEDKALKLSQASALSHDIKAADKLRGKYYRALQRLSNIIRTTLMPSLRSMPNAWECW